MACLCPERRRALGCPLWSPLKGKPVTEHCPRKQPFALFTSYTRSASSWKLESPDTGIGEGRSLPVWGTVTASCPALSLLRHPRHHEGL